MSSEPISFYGGVDPRTGIIVEKNHPLYGKSIKNKIIIFPYGKGSTVGSYIILQLKENKVAPIGIVNIKSEPIIVIGCILANIPLMDSVNRNLLNNIKSGYTGMLEVTKNKARLTIYDK